MRRQMFGPLAALIGAGAAASSASAINWMERMTSTPGVDRNHSALVNNITFGDAGEGLTNFNVTAGDQPLNTITGQLVSFQRPNGRSLDADLFCIRITDPANFSAIVTSAGGQDTQLALFRLNGEALAFNDNRTDSLTSVNPRLINNGLDVNSNPVNIPGLTVGDYLLGITRVDGTAALRRQNRPLDANGNLIFPGMVNGGNESTDPNAFTRRADLLPITPGTILATWELFATTASPFNASYTITLTGAEHSDIPSPAAAAGLLLLGLSAARRRR